MDENEEEDMENEDEGRTTTAEGTTLSEQSVSNRLLYEVC